MFVNCFVRPTNRVCSVWFHVFPHSYSFFFALVHFANSISFFPFLFFFTFIRVFLSTLLSFALFATFLAFFSFWSYQALPPFTLSHQAHEIKRRHTLSMQKQSIDTPTWHITALIHSRTRKHIRSWFITSTPSSEIVFATRSSSKCNFSIEKDKKAKRMRFLFDSYIFKHWAILFLSSLMSIPERVLLTSLFLCCSVISSPWTEIALKCFYTFVITMNAIETAHSVCPNVLKRFLSTCFVRLYCDGKQRHKIFFSSFVS